jgi:predicted dehydrogenase
MDVFCQADLLTPAFSQYVDIQCENGSFVGSIQGEMPSYIFLKEARAGYAVGRTDLSFGQRNLFDAQMDAFVQVVRRGKTLERNTIEDSIQLMRISTEIRSQIEG